ncbi:MAG: YchJ family metal-binding protein [Limnobacter sp.]|nr:YchJ family metal-binding protein [Limnobacter sp.]
MKSTQSESCECGLSPAATCCRAIHTGIKKAETAEQLMRSRYTAFVLLDEPYLLSTWHASKRPEALNLTADKPTKWLGLEVLKHVPNGDTATVEFVARFKEGGGPAFRLHEISRFVREGGQWFYVEGDILA